MQQAEYGVTEMAMGGGDTRFSADDTLLVKFYLHAKQNEGKSTEAGRPIFEELEYVQIMVPGSKSSIITRPATPMDKQRFSRHYAAFKANTEAEHIEGTLLEHWGGVNKAQAEELRFYNIRTVEQLAKMPDNQTQNMMGVVTLKNKAAEYLKIAEKTAAAEQIAELKLANVRLQAQMAELMAEVSSSNTEKTEIAPTALDAPEKASSGQRRTRRKANAE